VASGSPSSAAGRYQVIRSTLLEQKAELGLTGKELFDEKLQDRIATSLLNKRGYDQYLSGTMSEEKFMVSVAKEWASMPKDASGRSYYHGDGLNKAGTSPATLVLAMRKAKELETSPEPTIVASADTKTTGLTATHAQTMANGGVDQTGNPPANLTETHTQTLANGGTDEPAKVAAAETTKLDLSKLTPEQIAAATPQPVKPMTIGAGA